MSRLQANSGSCARARLRPEHPGLVVGGFLRRVRLNIPSLPSLCVCIRR